MSASPVQLEKSPIRRAQSQIAAIRPWRLQPELYNALMTTRVQIRIISLLEEAANSFEQLETLANRTLRSIPAEHVDEVELRAIERDYLNDENEPGSEMDHVVFIRFRTDKVDDEPDAPEA